MDKDKREAIRFLMKEGWNGNGAEAIVDALEDDGLLETITIQELKNVSEDYKSR